MRATSEVGQRTTVRVEDGLVVLSMLVTLGGIGLGAALGRPEVFGFTALTTLLILVIGGLVVARSERLAWLLVFGLVAGVLELWADWVHVVEIHSLIYTNFFGFKLLASPSYMPVGWWVTCVQFGYLALRLRDWVPAWASVAIVTALGMGIPPWYEQLAAPAHAWIYPPHGIMLSNTPLWVIGTYAGCMFAIGTLALSYYGRRAWGRAILAGIFAGASFAFFGVLAFSLLGR